MRGINMWNFSWILVLVLAAGCYYSPEIRQEKADPSYMSEEEAEALVQTKLRPYGIKFVYNMKLTRDKAQFVADGYDRDLRVGYEYRSHQGRDFEGEDDQSPDGLTDAEIDFLYSRQKDFREYFLIIPEGPKEEVVAAVDKFVEDLYAWEVLKKAKPKEKEKEALFPDEKKDKDMLPWEATGDLKKKRKEMEATESLEGKPGEGKEGGAADEWGGTETTFGTDTSGDDEEWGSEKKEEKEPEEKKEEKKEEK